MNWFSGGGCVVVVLGRSGCRREKRKKKFVLNLVWVWADAKTCRASLRGRSV